MSAPSRGAGEDDPAEEPPNWVITDRPARTSRGERTREKIEKAARELLEEQAYDRIAIADIARRSNTAVGTFYRYFVNKEALLVHLLSDSLWKMYTSTKGTWDLSAPSLENIESVTLSYLRSYWQHRNVMRSAFDAASQMESVRTMLWSMRRDLYGHMAVRLGQDQAMSALQPLDPEVAIRALGGMIEEYARRAFADEEYGPSSPQDPERVSGVLAAIWWRSVFGHTVFQSLPA